MTSCKSCGATVTICYWKRANLSFFYQREKKLFASGKTCRRPTLCSHPRLIWTFKYIEYVIIFYEIYYLYSIFSKVDHLFIWINFHDIYIYFVPTKQNLKRNFSFSFNSFVNLFKATKTLIALWIPVCWEKCKVSHFIIISNELQKII